jgi:AbiV family abortive infection protein
MPKSRPVTIVPPDVLARGYGAAIANSMQLFRASSTLLTTHPAIAIGLAQIGQEEVGKSLSVLAAIRLQSTEAPWKTFWTQWRDHRLKAHRAYLYEILNPQRIEINWPDGRRYAGEPLRTRISEEKEEGFYLNYDHARSEFVAPAETIKEIEAVSRLSTLAYLALTASAVHDTLVADDIEFRFMAFSEIAYRICTEEIYQQDAEALLNEFANRSERHEMLITDMRLRFESGRIRNRRPPAENG